MRRVSRWIGLRLSPLKSNSPGKLKELEMLVACMRYLRPHLFAITVDKWQGS